MDIQESSTKIISQSGALPRLLVPGSLSSCFLFSLATLISQLKIPKYIHAE